MHTQSLPRYLMQTQKCIHIFNPYLYSKLMVVSYTKISRHTQYKYSHSNFIMTHVPQKNLNRLVRYQTIWKSVSKTKPNSHIVRHQTVCNKHTEILHLLCCLHLQGRTFPYVAILWQNITGEHTLILITTRNSNLLQSLFALPDDGGSMSTKTTVVHCYQHT